MQSGTIQRGGVCETEFSTFAECSLSEQDSLYIGRLPRHMRFDEQRYADLWGIRPAVQPKLRIHGRVVTMPRYQSVFGADYYYTGQRHAAAEIPPLLMPLVSWCRETVETRLNGVVANWYSGPQHYIGRHRDSTKSMLHGAPIVMVSFGETRTLRMRPWRRPGQHFDLRVSDGDVVVLPFSTNLRWTHEIVKSVHNLGSRVSVTLRAFETTGP